MFNKIFSWFENRLNPYPESNPTTPEKGLFRFIWSSIDGMKGWIFLLAVLTVGTGVMEALLFQFMGLLVDWLGAYSPHFGKKKGICLPVWQLCLFLVLYGHLWA